MADGKTRPNEDLHHFALKRNSSVEKTLGRFPGRPLHLHVQLPGFHIIGHGVCHCRVYGIWGYPQGYRRERARTVDARLLSYFDGGLGTGKSPVSRRKTSSACVYQNISHDLYTMGFSTPGVETFVLVELSYRSISVILSYTDSSVTTLSVQNTLLFWAYLYLTGRCCDKAI